MNKKIHFFLLIALLLLILYFCKNSIENYTSSLISFSNIENFGNQLIIQPDGSMNPENTTVSVLTYDSDLDSGVTQASTCSDDSSWKNKDKNCRNYSVSGSNCNDVGDDGRTADEACRVACDNCNTYREIKRRSPSAVEGAESPPYSQFEGSMDANMGGGEDSRQLINRMDELEQNFDEKLNVLLVGQGYDPEQLQDSLKETWTERLTDIQNSFTDSINETLRRTVTSEIQTELQPLTGQGGAIDELEGDIASLGTLIGTSDGGDVNTLNFQISQLRDITTEMNVPINCSEKVRSECDREPLCNFITGEEISSAKRNRDDLNELNDLSEQAGAGESPILIPNFQDATGREYSYLEDLDAEAGVCMSNPDSLEFTLVAMQTQQEINDATRTDELMSRFALVDSALETIDENVDRDLELDTSITGRIDNLVGAVWVSDDDAIGHGYYQYSVDEDIVDNEDDDFLCPNGDPPEDCSRGQGSNCCRISTISELSRSVGSIQDSLTNVEGSQDDLIDLLVDLNRGGVCINKNTSNLCDGSTPPTDEQLASIFINPKKNIGGEDMNEAEFNAAVEAGSFAADEGTCNQTDDLENTCEAHWRRGGPEGVARDNCNGTNSHNYRCIWHDDIDSASSGRANSCFPRMTDEECMGLGTTSASCSNDACEFTRRLITADMWDTAPLSNIPCEGGDPSEECIYFSGEGGLYEQDVALRAQLSDFQTDISASIDALRDEGSASAGETPQVLCGVGTTLNAEGTLCEMTAQTGVSEQADLSGLPQWKICNILPTESGEGGMFHCPGRVRDDGAANVPPCVTSCDLSCEIPLGQPGHGEGTGNYANPTDTMVARAGQATEEDQATCQPP